MEVKKCMEIIAVQALIIVRRKNNPAKIQEVLWS